MTGTVEAPVLPAYDGASIANLVPALLALEDGPAASWLPETTQGARQVVLLVLDGLGWEQLQDRLFLAPNLASLAGGPITSVAPTTTATALTSITTGMAPADHGVVGYRLRVGQGEVMNVLRWRTAGGDARERVPPLDFQPIPAFGGRSVPVVTRAEFARTGFTVAHLSGVRLRGWRMPSSLPVEVARALSAGAPFVYAYYDGIDKVAHEWGLEEHFAAELAAADRMVGDVLADLPEGAVLVVTSDHGQVSVGDAVVALDRALMSNVELLSGEGRFRWLHAKPGQEGCLAERAAEVYGDVAWVRTRDEMVAEGWFGGAPSATVIRRLGDVALVARQRVAFLDPADTGETAMVSRHGSLTSAEMWVPLLAGAQGGAAGAAGVAGGRRPG